MLRTVKVPERFERLFKKAQEYVSRYFEGKHEDPSKGTIEIFGERYILIRAASMSVDFFDMIQNLYRDKKKDEAFGIAYQLLFDIAHAIARQDARNFHAKMKLKNPIEKLSAGPVHFAYSGWAFVDIMEESNPSADENYYLIYDHPFSFESDSWIRTKRKSVYPVCAMNAGYSSGWCEESFGIPLVAQEVLCKAKGDRKCRFIMAHPARIKSHIKDYFKKDPEIARRVTSYEIPGFFERKKLESVLVESEEKYKQVISAMTDAVMVFKVDTRQFVEVNEAAINLYGYGKDEFLRLTIDDITAESEKTDNSIREMLQGRSKRIPLRYHKKRDGTVFPVEIAASHFTLKGEKVLCGVIRDITERKIAEQRIEDLARFPAENKNPILRISKTGDLIYANTASAPLLRFWRCAANEKVPGNIHEEVRYALRSSTDKKIEVVIEERTFSLTFSPVSEASYVNVYVFDITEQKKWEAATKKHVKELEIFYKASAGREKRILELKEKIRMLKKRLEGRR